MDRTGLPNAAITKIVHRPAALGHVDRRKDGSDGRGYALSVTSTLRRTRPGSSRRWPRR
nr:MULTISPECIES: hypothetical protein [Streptomyces]